MCAVLGSVFVACVHWSLIGLTGGDASAHGTHVWQSRHCKTSYWPIPLILLLPLVSCRIGEASNPGPSPEEASGRGYLLGVANVTHLRHQAPRIAIRPFDAMVVSEHSLTVAQQSGLRGALGRDIFYHLSPLIPDAAHQVGGVGIIHRHHRPICPNVLHPALKILVTQGRVQLYALNIGGGILVHVYQVYGATNGNGSSQAASVTNSIVAHILSDIQLQAQHPVLITGDLNADPDKLQVVKDAIDDHVLYDVGAIASAFGGIDCAPTCRINATASPTRRDFVLANIQALKCIHFFRVDDDAGFPVHSVLQVKFHTRPQGTRCDSVHLPHCLHRAFHAHVVNTYRNDNIARGVERRQSLADRTSIFRCEVDLPEPSARITGSSGQVKHDIADNVADACDNLMAHVDELDEQAVEDDVADQVTNEQYQTQLHLLHECMDEKLSGHDDQWNGLLATGDSSKYITLLANCIEDAVVQFTSSDKATAKKLKGRGKVNATSKAVHPTHMRIPTDCSPEHQFGQSITRLTDQLTRLTAIKACLAKNSCSCPNHPATRGER